MLLQLKRLAVKVFIQIVRAGAVTTYYARRFFRAIRSPLAGLLRAVLRVVGVPLYRAVFFVRRFINKLYLPAKNKAVYVLTNRYAIHVLVIVIAFATTAMSVQAGTVRDEDFGQRSMLYGFVVDQPDNLIEVVRADTVTSKPSQYLGLTAVSVQPDIDFHDVTDDYVSTATGGSTVVARTISEAQESIAPRTEAVQYVVQTGDTIGTIAQRHGISINTLLWANNLSVRSVIRPGDSLTILPVDGLTHTVRSGDTVLAIARTYSADAGDIVEYNRLADAGDLRIGEELVIPGGTRTYRAPTPTRSVASVFRSTPAQSVGNVGSVVGSGRMLWPTDLRTITQYYGWRHTGLDVDCHFTHNNYAADDGIVQFVGWKGGYGLTVEVNHGNGIVTRYAHGARNYVAPGQAVAKGQAVQLCGSTGRSTGTHLHFEVVVNGRFRNPLEFIR